MCHSPGTLTSLTVFNCWPALRARHALVADVGLSVVCYPSSIVRPSHGHVSKTEQDRPIVTVEGRTWIYILPLL